MVVDILKSMDSDCLNRGKETLENRLRNIVQELRVNKWSNVTKLKTTDPLHLKRQSQKYSQNS